MSEPHDPNEDYRRRLPDPAVCRAQRVLPTLVECLVVKPRPHGCPHATFFGDGIFCENPDRDQIIARTDAERRERRRP
jgi:hypothetical protein